MPRTRRRAGSRRPCAPSSPWGNRRVAHREQARDGFGRAGGAHEVPGHALGGGHGRRGLAEHLADRLGFRSVVERGRGSVRVHVPDPSRREAGIVECELHARGRAFATRRRRGDVVRVGVAAVAHDFAVDARAAGDRAVPTLEQERGGALTHHEPVPFGVERPGSVFGVVVASAQRGHRCEGRDRDRRHARFAATGHHDVGGVVADEACGFTDHVHARHAHGRDAEVGPRPSELHRDGAGGRVRHHHRDEERADPAGALFDVHADLLFEGDEPTDSRTEDHCAPGRIGTGVAGVGEHVGCGRDPELRHTVEPACFLGAEIRRRVEVEHFAADPDGHRRRVVTPDRARGGASAHSRDQNVSRSVPAGVFTPRPVTTTRGPSVRPWFGSPALTTRPWRARGRRLARR